MTWKRVKFTMQLKNYHQGETHCQTNIEGTTDQLENSLQCVTKERKINFHFGAQMSHQ